MAMIMSARPSRWESTGAYGGRLTYTCPGNGLLILRWFVLLSSTSLVPLTYAHPKARKCFKPLGVKFSCVDSTGEGLPPSHFPGKTHLPFKGMSLRI